MGWPLLSRERELEQVGELLANGSDLVVQGPVGVGKSTLLAEAIGRLDLPERSVIWAHATDSTATIPLSPFAGLLPRTPSADPIAMLRSVLAEIEARSGEGGVVVAVDDVQLLDDASLSLVGLLLAQPWGCVAMTLRTGEGAGAAVRAVTQHPRVERVEVGPLERDDMAAVLRSALGPLHPELEDEMWRVTRGNPLLVRELAEHPVGRFEPDDSGQWVRVGPLFTPRLTDLVRERMALVDAEQRAALEVVSVAAPVPYAIVEAALGREALGTLEHDGLVSVTGSGDDAVVRPAHPIHGEILAAHTSDRRRRDAYGQVARAAAGFEGLIDPLRVAVWQLRSGTIGDPELAVQGATLALGRHDPALAEALLAPLATEHPPPGVAIPLGRAMALQNRADEAEAVLGAALPADDAEATELASVRAFNLAFGLGRVNDAIEHLAAIGTRMPAGELRSRLDAERGVIAGLAGDFQLAIRAAESALESPASEVTRTSAHVSLTLANAMLGRCDGFDRLVEVGVATASTTREQLPFARAQMLIMHAHAMMAAGQVDDAVRLATDELAQMDADEPTRSPLLSTLAIALGQQGRVHEAVETAREAELAIMSADTFALADQTVALRRWTAALGGSPVSEFSSDGSGYPSADPRIAVWSGRADAWTLAVQGDLDAAAERAAATGAATVAAQHLAWGAIVLHDAVRFGRPELVAEALRGVAASVVGAAFVTAAADHALALAERDPSALETLVDTFAGQGCPLLAAEVAAQLAAVRDADGDHVGAARAVAVSMTWETACSGVVTPALQSRPAVVGRREWQVAAAAAAGASSREIAERQFISVRTVDNHLGTTYRKLGVAGRGDLARYFSLDVSGS
jgi:DNA-binding CsgD family transcriptional regulator/tetratricopeptide (TPR) repeat protein